MKVVNNSITIPITQKQPIFYSSTDYLLRNTPQLTQHLTLTGKKSALVFESSTTKYEHCMSGTNQCIYVGYSNNGKRGDAASSEVTTYGRKDAKSPFWSSCGGAYLAKLLIQIRRPSHGGSVRGLVVHVKILQRRKWHPWMQGTGGLRQQKQSLCFSMFQKSPFDLLSPM